MQVYLNETLTADGAMARAAQIFGNYSVCIKGTWDGATVTIYRKNRADLTDIDIVKVYTEGTMLSGAECEYGYSESSDYLYYAAVSDAGSSTSLTIKFSTGVE